MSDINVSTESFELEANPTEKPGKAKTVSLIGQIVAAVWIAVWSAVKFISNPAVIGIDDVFLSGVGIAACFSPVYFSIIMDKIKEIRFGGGSGK